MTSEVYLMRLRAALTLAAIFMIVAASSTGALLAQQLFVASSSEERISIFDESGNAIPFSGDTRALTGPAGITIDHSGALIVADREKSRILRYMAGEPIPQIIVAKVAGPDGPALNAAGDLFFVSSPPYATKLLGDRESSQLTTRRGSTLTAPATETVRSVYVIPAGSGTLLKLADIPESRDLREIAVVRSGPFAGDLLVLSRSPGFVARLHEAPGGAWSRQSDLVTALPGPAGGMALTAAGDLLVSGLSGAIWRFDAEGNRQADFATGIEAGATKIAVGLDGIVYAANAGREAVGRFDGAGHRLSDLGSSLQAPAGLAVQGSAPTPVGTNVTVQLIPGLSVVFDRVVAAGFTTADQGELSGPDQDVTPCGNLLPSYIRPPEVGPFLVTHIQTTALFTDTVEVIQDHPDGQARLFKAACPPDGAGFIEQTTLAIPGDPRGRIKEFSEFVVGRDARSNTSVVAEKLAILQGLTGPDSEAATLIDPEILSVISRSINVIRVQIQEEFPDRAIDELNELIAFVRQLSGEGIPNIAGGPDGGSVNVAGGLVSVGATLKFSLSFEPTPWSGGIDGND
jgi:hypothetical protein